MTRDPQVLPYAAIVGQRALKEALEMCYVEPRISGVLVSGERGTGKSTTVRAFAQMLAKRLPVTIPINATEDRVVGGWDIGELMKSKARWKPGLLEDADGGLLFVDEVNLLDDHIVNILLDVTATGLLVVERDGKRIEKRLQYTLVGTMNPEEGGLRPQLLDRFGLMVDITTETDLEMRRKILEAVLGGEAERAGDRKRDEDKKRRLDAARKAAGKLKLPERVLDRCVRLARAFEADGHRGDFMLALAARACAAVRGAKQVDDEHVRAVAPLVLQHRRRIAGQRELVPWTTGDHERLAQVLAEA